MNFVHIKKIELFTSLPKEEVFNIQIENIQAMTGDKKGKFFPNPRHNYYRFLD
tara:strand:+ start:2317 stop:2475 length:159 start_codon:yes stop_codon:yes gene_type:complete